MGHEKMINYFTINILRRKALRDFFPQPFCFVMGQNGIIQPSFSSKIDWKHGLKIKCPTLELCLKNIFNGSTVSLFHYFLQLRNWVNYEDSYIFRRLYSKSAKPIMFSNMEVILTTFLTISELYLMKVLDYDEIISEAQTYITEFGKYMEPEVDTWDKCVTKSLQDRIRYYKTNKNWF